MKIEQSKFKKTVQNFVKTFIQICTKSYLIVNQPKHLLPIENT